MKKFKSYEKPPTIDSNKHRFVKENEKTSLHRDNRYI